MPATKSNKKGNYTKGKSMTLRKILLVTTALVLSLSAQAANNKVIYGEDDRLDVFETTDSLHYELAKSTAAMISGSSIKMNGDMAVITGSTLEDRGICATAKFAEQITAANCSGFLVGEDLLVTAGHCIRSQGDCRSYKWVFDFAIKSATVDKARVEVEKTSVYGCKEIIEQSLDRSTQDDFALIRLDRKVTDRNVLTVRTEGKVADKTELVVIGHPTGLPTKVADGAIVRSNGNSVYFQSNLDTFGGNSGSAVFDAKTGQVEGILVRGETDYVYDYNQGCRVPKECTNEGCRGEDVTRITNIKKLMDILAQQ